MSVFKEMLTDGTYVELSFEIGVETDEKLNRVKTVLEGTDYAYKMYQFTVKIPMKDDDASAMKREALGCARRLLAVFQGLEITLAWGNSFLYVTYSDFNKEVMKAEEQTELSKKARGEL